MARWIVRILAGIALLLMLAAAGLWWWSGQEGSLDWLLRRAARTGPLQWEGVQGSVRGHWHISRITWERDGLKLIAEDIELAWRPEALLKRTIQLELVQAARARVIDQRPPSNEPLKLPADLSLPWRVNVDLLKVGSLAYQGRTNVEAGQLAAHYHFDGVSHVVKLDSLQVAGGRYSGDVKLQARGPQALDANLAGRFQAPVPGTKEQVPLDFRLRAQGTASAFDARGQLQVVEGHAAAASLPRATATAHVTPFAAMPVPRGAADFERLDLALFWPQAPRTLLSGHVEVVPEGGAHWRLQADVRNGLAGAWDAHRLPVQSARGAGEWRNGAALVKSIKAEVGGGSIEGSGAWEGKGWSFQGRVDAVDPSQLLSSLAPLPLTGPVKLKGEGKAVDFDVALEARAPRRRPVAARKDKPENTLVAAAGALELRDAVAQGRYTSELLSLTQLRVHTSDASLEGQLEWNFAGSAASGRLQLHAPGLQAQAHGSLAPARGQGAGDLAASDLAQAQRWLARWPGVGNALERVALRGQAQAHVEWQGGWRDPTVQARATAASLAWQQAGRDPAGLPWVLHDASLQAQGRLRDAALDVHAQAQQGQRKLAVAVTGRLGATLGAPAVSWRGRVATATLQLQDPGITPGPWQLQLRQAVDWQASGGNFELGAGEAVLHAPAMASGAAASDAMLTWTAVRRQGGQLTSAGKLTGLPLAWIELVGGPQLAGSALSGDMVFDAQWNAQLGNTVRLDASLVRVRGDVQVLAEGVDGTATRVSAGVRDARISVSSQGEQLVFALLWDSERAGHAVGSIRTRLAHGAEGWSWPERAPMAGRVQAQLPQIGVWSLLAPPGWRLRGALSADIAIAGTRAQPELSGPLKADDLALRSVVDGVEFSNGELRAQLSGQRLVVSEFLLHGSGEAGASGGTLVATGEGHWTPQGPVFQAHAVLSQLRASIRSDRQLTISGPVDARVDGATASVIGELRVDRARIKIPEESPPKLGDDVVVHNAPGVAETEAEREQRTPPPSESKRRRPLTLRVAIDLGDDFRIAGRGVDTRLAGTVQVQGGAVGGLPQMVGALHTVGGTYKAYAQQMDIDRGELRFTGAADNPALDVLAIRPNLTQKVGVRITGRAQSPHVELYSDAGLSDAETLSYVVLGRSSAGTGAETALLQRAAAALLAGRGGTGKGLAGSLGLDDLTVANDGTTGPVVRLGKRFARNFYAAYERSLSGAIGTLYIFYDVSKRMTVRAEAGERAGLDLIFTFSFDGRGSK